MDKAEQLNLLKHTGRYVRKCVRKVTRRIDVVEAKSVENAVELEQRIDALQRDVAALSRALELKGFWSAPGDTLDETRRRAARARLLQA